MATAEPVRHPWRRWVGLGLAVVLLALAAVWVVRQVRADDDAAPPPATASDPAPTGSGGVPSAGTSSPSSAPTPTPAPASASDDPTSPAATPTSTSTSEDPRTEVPAPTSGPSTRSPKPLDEPEQVRRGLTAEVSRLEAVAGEANGPGEVAGPALRATITLSNDTDGALDLSNTVVSLFYGTEQTPASPLSGPGTKALPGRVRSGQDASGRFVFALPAEARADVLITVDYAVDTPVVAFRGPAPR